MAKKKNNGDKFDAKHKRNVKMYELQIDKIYKEAIREAVALSESLGDVGTDKPFTFDDYPVTRKRIDKLMSGLKSNVEVVVLNGIKSEWTLANNKNNVLCDFVFGKNKGKLTQEQYRRYYSNNDDARQAFEQRRTNGLNLSDRVWNYTKQFKEEIEMGLDLGIRSGRSAEDMSRDIRQYLRKPNELFRRVRDEHGQLHLSKRAAAYHPGQGVYRSSYKNARRLAVTETNIAYNTADHLRWQQMDFVVGIEVHLSGNHSFKGRDGKHQELHDICDELAGKYPKDFKFTGWHPNCRCYATTILKTEEEMDAELDARLAGKKPPTGSKNEVTDVPQAFKDWVKNNKERAKGWSNMPYFIKNNPHYVDGFEVDTYTPIERKFTRARRTNEAMKESLDIFLQRKYPDIHSTEKAAIYHYTQGNFPASRQLNNQLRRGELTEFNEAFSNLLSSGLAKIEPIEAIVYRTIRLNKTKLGEFYENASNKSETTFKGYTSTSLDKQFVVDFANAHHGKKNNETDVILVINGKSGRPIEDFSQFGIRYSDRKNQKEVLFDKGLKLKFEKVEMENGFPVFYLTEI